MKFRKIELLVMIVLILEFIACFLMLNHLTIFQYMLFVQVVPSVSFPAPFSPFQIC